MGRVVDQLPLVGVDVRVRGRHLARGGLAETERRERLRVELHGHRGLGHGQVLAAEPDEVH
ncbi:MAG TPA: hypothetical protein VFA92_07445, partial [Candidatus Binatia bacterium]|nr:hypothetical protein [Candidatus Binatia bacterium]